MIDFSRVRAVLIDIDGTLLDSNDAHATSWVDAFAHHGRDVPFARVRPLIGKGGDKLLADVAGLDDESGEGEAIGETRKRLFKERKLASLVPTRGARALLEFLQAIDVERVVATSASGEETDALLRQAGVADLIADASTSQDADASKPDPDIVHAALKKAGVAPEAALMIGDTPYDVDAAAKAGVVAVALRCGG